jgi:hypothetical protein
VGSSRCGGLGGFVLQTGPPLDRNPFPRDRSSPPNFRSNEMNSLGTTVTRTRRWGGTPHRVAGRAPTGLSRLAPKFARLRSRRQGPNGLVQLDREFDRLEGRHPSALRSSAGSAHG